MNMSRSYKKTFITGNTTAASEKHDKRLANRRFRRLTRLHIVASRETLHSIREVSNVWDFNKDGRHWFGHLARHNPRWANPLNPFMVMTERRKKVTTREYWLDQFERLRRK